MDPIPSRGFFVTGNDTEVGKTYAACTLLRGLADHGITSAGYKPVASGAHRVDGELVADDAVALWEASERRGSLVAVCPQVFEAPLAPHRAAALEHRKVDVELLSRGAHDWSEACDCLVVEGAGGLMSPIADDLYNIDLAVTLGYPLIVVVANRIGAINQCLQTVITAACYGKGVDVAGVILNDAEAQLGPSAESNAAEIESRCQAPFLGRLKHGGTFEALDWHALQLD